jgi:hypothetical protein
MTFGYHPKTEYCVHLMLQSAEFIVGLTRHGSCLIIFRHSCIFKQFDRLGGCMTSFTIMESPRHMAASGTRHPIDSSTFSCNVIISELEILIS